jgi:hypothetical protein
MNSKFWILGILFLILESASFSLDEKTVDTWCLSLLEHNVVDRERPWSEELEKSTRRLWAEASQEEIWAACLRIMRDPEKKKYWGVMYDFMTTGKGDRREVIEWTFDHWNALGEVPYAQGSAINFIGTYGIPSDATWLRNLLQTIPVTKKIWRINIERTADNIDFNNSEAGRAAGFGPHDSERPNPTHPQPPLQSSAPLNLPPQPLKQSTVSPPPASGRSYPWMVGVVVVISALGVLWLSVKKKRSSSHTSRNRP